MPEMSKTLRAALSGAFCLVVLAGMLVGHAWPLMTGEPIILEVIARDPRDLFRGDYVVLTYPIDNLVVSSAAPVAGGTDDGVAVKPLGDWWDDVEKELAAGEYWKRPTLQDRIVYVQLAPQPSTITGVPQVHRAVSVSDQPIAGSVNLAGRIRNISPMSYTDPHSPVAMQLHYGIDALYVQEGTGLQIEKAIRDGTVHAVVSVTSSGSARLKDLVIAGKTWSSIIGGE